MNMDSTHRVASGSLEGGLAWRSKAARFAAGVTLVNVLVGAGFSVAGLVAPKAILPAGYVPTDASYVFALYAANRAIGLACVTAWVVWSRSAAGLIVLGVLAGIIQLCDAGIGLVQTDPGKTLGPLVIALVQFVAVWRLVRAGAVVGSGAESGRA
jgi:hypothetical protein